MVDSHLSARLERTRVEFKLLLDEAASAVPDDGGLVHGAGEQQVALLVPLEREDGPLVSTQHVFQLPCTHTQLKLGR